MNVNYEYNFKMPQDYKSSGAGKFVWDKINYIHNNPVEAGFVKQPQEWIYSSATNYQDMESIMEVETISQRLITVK